MGGADSMFRPPSSDENIMIQESRLKLTTIIQNSRIPIRDGF